MKSRFTRFLEVFTTPALILTITLALTTLIRVTYMQLDTTRALSRANEVTLSAQFLASYPWRLHQDPDSSVWVLRQVGDKSVIVLPPWCVAKIEEKGVLEEGRMLMFRYVGALEKTTEQVANTSPFNLVDPSWN